jgi:hypothetical protein
LDYYKLDFRNIFNVFLEFIMANICVLIFTVLSIKMGTEGNGLKYIYTSFFGVFVYTFFKLYFSQIKTIILGTIFIGIYFISYAYLLTNYNFAIQTVFLTFIVILFFIVKKFLKNRDDNQAILNYSIHLIIAVFISLFISLIIYLGVILILYIIEDLFDFGRYRNMAFYIAVIIFPIIGLNIFLNYIINLKTKNIEIPKIVEVLYKYLFLFFSVFISILIFIYFGKIIFTWQLPSGEIVTYGLIYSIIVLIANIFFITYNIYHKLSKYLWIGIFICSLMMLMAIIIRINQYGATDYRIISFVGIVWFMLISFYFFIKNNPKIFYIFYSFVIVFFITFLIKSFIGYFYQAKILNDLIEKNRPFSKNTDINIKRKVSENLEYLFKNYEKSFFDKQIILNTNFSDCYNKQNSYLSATCATKKLGFEFVFEYGQVQNISNYTMIESDYKQFIGLNIKGYDYISDISEFGNVFNENNFSIKADKTEIVFIDNNQRIFLKLDMKNSIEKLNELAIKKGTFNDNIPLEKMIFNIENSDIKCKLYISRIDISNENEIVYLSAKMLIKFKKKFFDRL